MKNYTKAKVQGPSVAEANELPELMTAMKRIAERLEALEKKMDRVISWISSGSSEGLEHPEPVLLPVVTSLPFRQPGPPKHSSDVKPVQGQSHGHAHERRERILHKAVCADCHQDCEIPFKPTGERPVYCKECFSKRKAGDSFKANGGDRPAPDLPDVPAAVNPTQRKVIVTKKGVGKVTISEIIRSSARNIFQPGKSQRPDKKPRK